MREPIQNAEIKFSSTDGTPDKIDFEYPTKYEGASEYSIWGWLKFDKGFKIVNKHMIARLTTNPPAIQRDF